MEASFIVAPDALVESWPVTDIVAMRPADLDPLLALAPEIVLLGSGETQAFPPAEVMAACLQRGIGPEAMTNAAAARTFNVLASEGRRVVAGFVISRLMLLLVIPAKAGIASGNGDLVGHGPGDEPMPELSRNRQIGRSNSACRGRRA